MSADRWGKCPRCKRRAVKAANEALTTAMAAYGTVSPEEYERGMQAARELTVKASKMPDTVREDFYAYRKGDGPEVEIYYQATCEECDLSLHVSETRSFEGVEDESEATP